MVVPRVQVSKQAEQGQALRGEREPGDLGLMWGWGREARSGVTALLQAGPGEKRIPWGHQEQCVGGFEAFLDGF